MFDLALISIISYLLGSIPFSYLIAKAYGKNLFEIGSRNIGAANVYRATGKPESFIFASIGDIGKGALAIFLAQKLGFLGLHLPTTLLAFGEAPNLILAQALAGFFVVAGHNWPIFLKFKGGRGLASLLGVLLVLNWRVIFVIFAVLLFFIILTELIMKKKIELKGGIKEKFKSLFSIFISQVLGRVIGMVAAVILVYLLYPQVFTIALGATILAGIKHVKRTKEFLKKNATK